ncbi:MAG: DUF4347 domain-containing protein [Scytolyngbya sp. HA4215-MV1]|jgi:hypothetical protein|nr:DUF4347 domain-containing protein [Scytolyngbya sp. HA4215-MV1]
MDTIRLSTNLSVWSSQVVFSSLAGRLFSSPTFQWFASAFNTPATVLFIDSAVVNYSRLIEGVVPGVEVYVLDTEKDAIAQITQVLQGRTGITSLHLVSHGQPGNLLLGKSCLNLAALRQKADQIRTWSKALTDKADILLYGCQVAEGAEGQAFVQQLAQLTGANIAASRHLIGNVALGGSWNLETQVGAITSSLVFDPWTLAEYGFTLAPLVAESFRNNDVSQFTWLFGNSGGSAQDPFLTARVGPPSAPGGLPGRSSSPAIDTNGNGFLRLTDNSTNQGGFVIYNQPFTASGGLTISFEIFQYGGTGADGISFFLVDGNSNPTQAGLSGGGLGYVDIVGGYLGIGFDAFGNFSSPTLGGQTSVSRGGPGNRPDSVAVRGGQATNYGFLTGQPLSSALDVTAANGGNRTNSRHLVQINLTQAGALSVQIDLNQDNDFADAGEQPITNFNVATVNGALPATFKLGFAASTGSSTNIHEIRSLDVQSILPILDFTAPSITVPEAIGTATTTVQLSNAVASNVTVPFTLTGTAQNGVDYTVGTGNFVITAGSTTATANFNIINDTLVEPNETIILTLQPSTTAGVGLNKVQTITILDDDGGGGGGGGGGGNPSALLTAIPDLRVGCGIDQTFTVTYNSANSVNFASLDSQDIRVTGPRGFNQLATLVSVTPSGNNTTLTATYRFTAPGGTWGMSDNGTYVFSLEANQVSNTIGGFGTAGALGTLKVLINDINDFNGDGLADIVWRNYGTTGAEAGKTYIWTMDGPVPTSTVALPFDILNPNWVVEGTGDFNGDGMADIVWRNYDTTGPEAGKVYIWLMNRTTPVATVVLPLAVTNPLWRIDGIGDFNGDCELDILWRNYESTGPEAGMVSIWTMNGVTPTSTVVLPLRVTDPKWVIESVGDYNGDDSPDILWHYYGTTGPQVGQVVFWTMKGTTPTSTVVMANNVFDTSWVVEACGDYNKDGMNDIVWRNYSTGVNLIWFNINTVAVAQQTFLTVTSAQWDVEDVIVEGAGQPLDPRRRFPAI